MATYGLASKLKGLLAPEISKFTKIHEFQKNVYAKLRLLSDYELIIPIKTNKKAYVCICFIFKIGDATSTRIYFPILLHQNGKIDLRACNVSNFEDKAYAHISSSSKLEMV